MNTIDELCAYLMFGEVFYSRLMAFWQFLGTGYAKDCHKNLISQQTHFL
jgi:hypothetical protein